MKRTLSSFSPRLINLTGQKIGRWLVLSYVGCVKTETIKHPTSLWLCRCDCGQEKKINSAALRRTGKAKSRGCRECYLERRKTKTKFSLGDKILLTVFDVTTPGIIGGITLTSGIVYLVIEGDNIYDLDQDRNWYPENYISKRSK